MSEEQKQGGQQNPNNQFRRRHHHHGHGNHGGDKNQNTQGVAVQSQNKQVNNKQNPENQNKTNPQQNNKGNQQNNKGNQQNKGNNQPNKGNNNPNNNKQNNNQQNNGNNKNQKQQGQNKQSQNNQQNKQQNKQPQNQQGQNKKQVQNENANNKQNKKDNISYEQPVNENRKDTYVYSLDGNLYVNLTNKCSNGCDFCVRNERSSYFGNYLWIRHGDPTAEKVISAFKEFGDLSKYKEVVFCGFGEPTYKVAEMCEVADFAHSKGLKTRLNTNGQGNLINKRDILPELKDKIDMINISLNAPDAESYQKICRSMFKETAYDALIEFGKLAKRNGIPCRFSVVDIIGEDAVASCKKLAENNGIPLYVRKYISES